MVSDPSRRIHEALVHRLAKCSNFRHCRGHRRRRCGVWWEQWTARRGGIGRHGHRRRGTGGGAGAGSGGTACTLAQVNKILQHDRHERGCTVAQALPRRGWLGGRARPRVSGMADEAGRKGADDDGGRDPVHVLVREHGLCLSHGGQQSGERAPHRQDQPGHRPPAGRRAAPTCPTWARISPPPTSPASSPI